MRQRPQRLTLYDPAIYAIRVQGTLDGTWSDRMGGLRIQTVSAGHESATELTGELADQAALISVLTSLYDLGMPLLSVEHVRLAR